MIRLFCVGVGFPHLSSHQRFYCITLYMFRHQKMVNMKSEFVILEYRGLDDFVCKSEGFLYQASKRYVIKDLRLLMSI